MSQFINDMLRHLTAPHTAVTAHLDATRSANTLDVSDYTRADVGLSAAAAIQQWAADSDELDEGETLADRLLALMIGIADANKDGDISDDEHNILGLALNHGWDYLEQMGASEEDIDALLNHWDEGAAQRLRELVLAQLPDGEDAAATDIDRFVFGEEATASLFDATFDAVYQKRLVIRKGKKVRINQRVSGKVRLSAKQKIAIAKARLKSHSAAARMRRLKSMRLRRKLGL